MRRGTKRKFGTKKRLREALYKSLATALIDHGKIKTTLAKAKSLSSFADKLVTTAKKQDLAARRELSKTFHPKIVKKLIDEIAPRFSERKGGYTRIIRLGQRKSDAAQMSLIEFTA
ncbi:MAG: 50S ribosomal protein L17 [Candidatus Yanofskybacteria bacterium RIFCSPHIGHO2_01_FULL_43_42]|uniref:50S ribosomal protein L17 n=1 Tax=Candidatus Yanofskybacteria bacterium RIFCSPLOWO2_01_FULL_43_22 TaxID=1802695 RepID=A0A1F8GDG4_9BACT|nr:MAG: 50S ribosomal protein L17 [Candidatus Yanofskybacteria bacterium RIFCSPHIGHO2_01_FULL_43_42]OGN12709.1 MAG: 50S ribosomal protein L17 [Candidatus Yanofskybacteria bacterium RIFCSPHIGHO2_02_FULL_43_17]OGN23331.1 MAG: 50S ribosomal protein L17 [Candidatus Yanofskybacteria bacterium RIFCSPLOWO2_01_FULL_43_22]